MSGSAAEGARAGDANGAAAIVTFPAGLYLAIEMGVFREMASVVGARYVAAAAAEAWDGG